MKKILFIILFLSANSFATNYYVSTIGNDGADGSIGSPWATFLKASTSAVAGDTIYVRAGTYTETLAINYGVSALGTSWSNPITIMAFPSEYVLVQPGGSKEAALSFATDPPYDTPRDLYWIVQDMHFDCTHCSYQNNFTCQGNLGDNVKIINCEITGSWNTGLLPASHYWWLINDDVHGNCLSGEVGDHGLYWDGTHLIVDGGSYHDNNVGNGIQIHHDSTNIASSNTVMNATIYGNSVTGFNAGLEMGTGSNNIAFNNIIYNNGGGRELQIDYRCGLTGNPCRAYNNTIYSTMSAVGISIGGVDPTFGAVVQDNLVAAHNPSNVYINDNGHDSVVLNNLQSMDVGFIDPVTHNFIISSTSTAIGYGLNITSQAISGLSTDIRGYHRPAVGVWDAGAYSFADNVSSARSTMKAGGTFKGGGTVH